MSVSFCARTMSEGGGFSMVPLQQALHLSEPTRDTTRTIHDGNNIPHAKLCIKCAGLFEGETFKFDPDYEHWDPFTLQESHAQHCHLCVLLYQALQHKAQRSPFTTNLACRVRITKYTYGKNALKVDFLYQDPRSNTEAAATKRVSLRAFLETGNTPLTSSAGLNGEFDSTDSPQCFRLVSRWLDECHSSHPNCNYPSVSRVLPTRLIELKRSIGRITVRLVNSFHLFTNVRYATLSHCWGASMPPETLRSDNLKHFQEEIPWSSLPKTFQQAAVFCNKLDVQYLWIDALCIVQDSAEDWLKESTKMWEVYKFSVFNIAAGASENSSGGLFRRRHPLTIRPLLIGTNWIELSATYRVFDYSKFHRDMIDCPLYTRGWVTQERFLAPRVILFSADEIYWECNEKTASECFPTRLPVTASFPSKANVGLTLMTSKTDSEILQTWWRLVRIYSKSHLTLSRDKLIAFSAVARQIQSCLPDTPAYLAGLWQHRLTDNLLWLVEDENTEYCTEKYEYRAPSWSWAAIDAAVCSLVFDPDPPRVQAKCVCQIVRAVTDPQVDQFGAVGRAYLRAHGLVLRTMMSQDLAFPARNARGSAGERSNLALIVEYVQYSNQCRALVEGTFRFDRSTIDGNYSRLFLLPIQMRYFLISGRLTCAGLILVRDTNCKGQYRRIGLFFMVDWAQFSRLAERVPLAEDDYEQFSQDVEVGLHCHDHCNIEESLARWPTYVIKIV